MSFLCSSLLLLAQEPNLDSANDAIDTLDKLGKAGPVTLALALMVAAIVFAVWMMRKNWKLQSGHADELKDRETIAKDESKKTLDAVLDAAEKRRAEEKVIYREMIDRGHEATQALEGSNRAIEAFKLALETSQKRLEDLDRSQEKRFDELLRAINQKSNT